jgi:hypothetical protein
MRNRLLKSGKNCSAIWTLTAPVNIFFERIGFLVKNRFERIIHERGVCFNPLKIAQAFENCAEQISAGQPCKGISWTNFLAMVFDKEVFSEHQELVEMLKARMGCMDGFHLSKVYAFLKRSHYEDVQFKEVFHWMNDTGYLDAEYKFSDAHLLSLITNEFEYTDKDHTDDFYLSDPKIDAAEIPELEGLLAMRDAGRSKSHGQLGLEGDRSPGGESLVSPSKL